LASGHKSERLHVRDVTARRIDFAMAVHVPQMQQVIGTDGSQCFAIWRESNAIDQTRLPFKDAQFLAGRDSPETYRPIGAGGRKKAAIGRKGEPAEVPPELGGEREAMDQTAGARFPQMNPLADVRRGQKLAVGREKERTWGAESRCRATVSQ